MLHGREGNLARCRLDKGSRSGLDQGCYVLVNDFISQELETNSHPQGSNTT